MKISFDKLSKLKRRGIQTAVVTSSALMLSFATIFGPVQMPVRAEESKEEIEQQKEEAAAGKAEAEANIEKYQKQIDDLVAAVAELDAQVTNLSAQIVEKKQEEADLQDEIDKTQKKLAAAQVSEDNQYQAMKKRIQYLYEEGNVEYIDALMSSASFEDSLNKSEYVDQISSYDQKQLNKLVKTKKKIKKYENTLQKDLKEVETVRADLEKQQGDLDEVIAQKDAEINKYSGDKEIQEAIAAEFAQKEADFDQQLIDIAKREAAEAERRRREEEERRRQEEEQRRLEEEQRRQEEENAAAEDDEDDDEDEDSSDEDNDGDDSSDNGGGSSSGSGQFIWPVNGVITDYFGPRDAPTAGASTYHQGLDIGCGYGEPIAASDGGVVTFAGWGESGGNYVMIDHGNGYVTMYLHNSSLAVSAGDVVSQGQTIAYAGSTGYSTGTHCHFSILYNGSYVDPLDYL